MQLVKSYCDKRVCKSVGRGTRWRRSHQKFGTNLDWFEDFQLVLWWIVWLKSRKFLYEGPGLIRSSPCFHVSAAFVRWHFTLRRSTASSRRWLCSSIIRAAVFLPAQTIKLSPRVWSDSSSSFLILLCLCRGIKGKQEDKRFPDSTEQREKSLFVAPFTLHVCVLGLHLWMKLSRLISGPFLEVSSRYQTLI